MDTAIYPGSFDPITIGHVDIINRLHKMYDQIIVLVANSEKKKYLFTLDERAQLARDCFKNLSNVKVDTFDGLTVEYAQKNSAKVIIRGLRAVADFEYEMAMANMNKKLNVEIETLIVFANPEYNYISSRMVKEVALNGGSINEMVSPHVAQAIMQKVK